MTISTKRTFWWSVAFHSFHWELHLVSGHTPCCMCHSLGPSPLLPFPRIFRAGIWEATAVVYVISIIVSTNTWSTPNTPPRMASQPPSEPSSMNSGNVRHMDDRNCSGKFETGATAEFTTPSDLRRRHLFSPVEAVGVVIGTPLAWHHPMQRSGPLVDSRRQEHSDLRKRQWVPATSYSWRVTWWQLWSLCQKTKRASLSMSEEIERDATIEIAYGSCPAVQDSCKDQEVPEFWLHGRTVVHCRIPLRTPFSQVMNHESWGVQNPFCKTSDTANLSRQIFHLIVKCQVSCSKNS